MFQTKVTETTKTHILCPITFLFRKPSRLRDNVETYGRREQVTDDNTTHARKVRLQTHTQNMKYVLLFHGNSGYANASQFYVIRTLPVLLQSSATTRTKSGDTSPKWEHRAIPNAKKSRPNKHKKTRNQPLWPDFGFSLYDVR